MKTFNIELDEEDLQVLVEFIDIAVKNVGLKSIGPANKLIGKITSAKLKKEEETDKLQT